MQIIESVFKQNRPTSGFPSHPCVNPDARHKLARIHLPVAKKCNITCGFCARHNFGSESNLPGVSAGIMSPDEALESLRAQRNIHGKEAIVGVSGPGEPLFNPETFETFGLIRKSFPEHPLCLCTNGLLLEEKASELSVLGLTTISVTMTGIAPGVVKKLQPRINAGEAALTGETAAAKLIESQIKGIKAVKEKGMFIKVNAIVAKGINDAHLPDLAKSLAEMGAGIMNIAPVIPPNTKSLLRPPGDARLESLRNECAAYIPQFRNCRQCRSDAAGIPGAA